MFIDIHSHCLKVKDHKAIVSLNYDFDATYPDNYTLGIHPWFIDPTKDLSEIIQDFKTIFKKSSPIGIGEIGLDKVFKGISYELQKSYFDELVKFASENLINTMIIHCVRAYDDIDLIIKKNNYQGNVIFHDYNGNKQQTKKFLKSNYYFSFLNALINKDQKGFESLKIIPTDRLFFETDDQQERLIKDIYHAYINEFGISKETLLKQINNNAKRCFNLN